MAALLAGCSGTVTPAYAPPRPTVIYLCDYGYHSSLLLPVGDGAFVEYLYGDWEWAAMNHTGAAGVVRSAFFSSGATLGRRFDYAPGVNGVPRPPTVPVREVPLVVDGAAVDRLVAALDARWRAHADTAVYTGADNGFYAYVRDDEPYGWVHNCNRVTAEWLWTVGCDTGGVPTLSHFRVLAPAEPGGR